MNKYVISMYVPFLHHFVKKLFFKIEEKWKRRTFKQILWVIKSTQQCFPSVLMLKGKNLMPLIPLLSFLFFLFSYDI